MNKYEYIAYNEVENFIFILKQEVFFIQFAFFVHWKLDYIQLSCIVRYKSIFLI